MSLHVTWIELNSKLKILNWNQIQLKGNEIQIAAKNIKNLLVNLEVCKGQLMEPKVIWSKLVRQIKMGIL
jgi:hypothetical protein